MDRPSKIAILLILVGLLNGCYGCPPTFPARECRDFFNLGSIQQEHKFHSFTIEKQVDIYLCGMNREPPEIAYAAYIAGGGQKNIPYLLKRLETESLEIRQVHIINIFPFLAIKGHLRGRVDVLSRLKAVASQMKDEQTKTEAHEHIKEVERNL